MKALSPSTRLYVLLARAAPVGVIFRRGPTKHTLLIRWNTADDTFEPGQWFKGRIYEHRCDLSPEGTRLIYFAAKHKPPLYSWTAISRPPYLTALALWPKGDCYNGGGQFVTADEIILNHGASESELHPDFRNPGVRVVGHGAEYLGENDTVQPTVVQRECWKLSAPGEWKRVDAKSGGWWVGDPPEIWHKRQAGSNLRLEQKSVTMGRKNAPWQELEYRVLDPHRPESETNLGLLAWADWDQAAIWFTLTAGGSIGARYLLRGDLQPTRLLADFTDLKFAEVEAPEWALHWS